MFERVQCEAKGFTIVHVEAPNGERYPGCLHPHVNELCMFLRNERIPDATWSLLIPEAFLGAGREPYTGHRPVLGMTWRAGADRIGFDWLRYEGNIDLDVQADIVIESEETILYRVTVRNPTDRPIEHVHFNACFNHGQAPPFGRDVFVLGTEGWTRTSDLSFTGQPPIPYFVVKGREAEWRRADQEREHYPVHLTFQPLEPISVTPGVSGDKPFTLAHACPRAALLWHNVKHPCTDLWPWVGTIGPGDETQVQGRLYFLDGQVDPDAIVMRYRSEAWL